MRLAPYGLAAALALATPARAEVSPGTIDPSTASPSTVVQAPGTGSDSSLPEAGIKGRKLDWPVQAVIAFGDDQQKLAANGRAVMVRQAEWLKANPNAKLLVVGYLNGEGTREYLLVLSLRLAETVKEELIGQGVDAKRVATVGYGKEKPAECGADLGGRPVRVCTVSLPYAAE
jgi:peptidoglycan-associated lipoprotein